MNRFFCCRSVCLFVCFLLHCNIFDCVVNADQLSDQLTSEPITQIVDDVTRFGDPQRGAIAFYLPTMNCARCHQPVEGRRLGPNLAEKRDVKIEHLIQSVLQPSAVINLGFENSSIMLDNGTTVTGIVVNETADHIDVDQIEQRDKPLRVHRIDIEDSKKSEKSSMPDGLANQLSNRQQFLDLIAYLNEIASGGSQRATELSPTGMMANVPLPEYESHVDHAGLIEGLDDAASIRGAETYRLRCASCHGTIEAEGSMPTSLRFASGAFKNGNDPFRMYQTLTHGYGMMNPQRWMVPRQKYDVIHYIRQHFLQANNSAQFSVIDDAYLSGLPVGDTFGPKPVDVQPWTQMDYGPSFINTIEIGSDGTNIAQKGITVRLDDGPGGVESGNHWMLYDHDTMRLAAAWSGRFIDYEGISFNGAHNRHPRASGEIQFKNPTGPGWGRPTDGSFTDDRLIGRDNKRYGPLDRGWAQYKGMYRYGRQTVIEYTVGKTRILESPGLTFVDDRPVYIRNLNIGARDQDLVLQIAKIENGKLTISEKNIATVIADVIADDKQTANSPTRKNIDLADGRFGQIAVGDAFDMTSKDFTITARIKTDRDGTIFSQTRDQNKWAADGKTFFIRNRKLAFDIGWVGAIESRRKVANGKWHDVAMTWRANDGQVQLYVDGKTAGAPGNLKPKKRQTDQVMRIGFTNEDFPATPAFDGSIANLQFYQHLLTPDEIATGDITHAPLATWNRVDRNQVPNEAGDKNLAAVISGSPTINGSPTPLQKPAGLLASVSDNLSDAQWSYADECLRLKIPAGEAVNITIGQHPLTNAKLANGNLSKPIDSAELAAKIQSAIQPVDLTPLVAGGPPNWPQKLSSEMIRGDEDGPFAVDVLTRPTNNPWNAQLRLTGLDFLPDGNSMVVSAWDGSIWKVTGFKDLPSQKLTWQRIAAGLFQPLGIKWIDGKIYVTCRDQIAVLHDLNGDGETDWYQSLNSDHQVTEHFHEFAMGLQTDDEGNFYYAKSARHALPALVPHHGTLLKVSADGETTEILATGFRAANGVCLNPDGSFVVTDQEGHWNPKNRINWVTPGGFYGNMFGYHDITDSSDSAMDDPLCWITNEFDRSPSELLWVDSPKWKPLFGSLLNFSYGYGKVYIVPHEKIDGQVQGGMAEFPIEQFPTGVMRGRFSPHDGQLYCCGMFAWAGSQHQPGGLYRIRYTGKPVHLPVQLHAKSDGIEIGFSGDIDRESAADPKNFAVTVWDLKRTKNYGSKHYNERRLSVDSAVLLSDSKTVKLSIPNLQPTWGMEIKYSLKKSNGEPLRGKIHNTIHRLK